MQTHGSILRVKVTQCNSPSLHTSTREFLEEPIKKSGEKKREKERGKGRKKKRKRRRKKRRKRREISI
jgi:hypothetical protein